MKKFVFIFLSAFIFLGCKKTPVTTSQPTTPGVEFKIVNQKLFVDSNIIFENYSETLNVTYLWDFGDGNTSSEKLPVFSFKKRGTYTIKLTVTNKEGLSGSFSKTVDVSIGEKTIWHDNNQTVIDIEEAKDGGFIVIGFKATGSINNPFMYQSFVAKHDDQLRLLWLKTGVAYPKVSAANIEPADDDGFIISGNFKGSDSQFSLTKIDKDGNILWTNNYNNSKGYIKQVKKVNDGFILTGAERHLVNIDSLEFPVIIKVNTNGQEVWNKHFFDKGLLSSGNVVVMNDGYVFASYKMNITGCLNCNDSLTVTKLNTNGDIVWMKINYVPANSISDAKIVFVDNKFVVYKSGSASLWIFNSQGNYTTSISIPATPALVAVATDGLFIGGAFNSNGNFNYLRKYTSSLTTFGFSWEKLYGITPGPCSPSRGNAISLKPTKDGNYIYLGLVYGCQLISNGPTLLMKLDKDGVVL